MLVNVVLGAAAAAALALAAREVRLIARPAAPFAPPAFEPPKAEEGATGRSRSKADLALIVKRLRPSQEPTPPAEPKEAPGPAKAPVNLRVCGTIVGGPRSFAIIAFPDGRQELVPEGGTVGPAKVLKVCGDSVDLEIQGEVRNVPVYEGEKAKR